MSKTQTDGQTAVTHITESVFLLRTVSVCGGRTVGGRVLHARGGGCMRGERGWEEPRMKEEEGEVGWKSSRKSLMG